MSNQPLMRIEVIGEAPGHRFTLLRMFAMYALLAAGGVLVSLISLGAVLGGSYGALIPLSILALITGAAFFQFVTAALDLRTRPTFTRGEVTRLWTKGGLFWFFRSHYAMVNREVFVMAPHIWIQISDGNTIELHHWPHTRTLIRAVLLSGEIAGLPAHEPASPLPEA